MDNCIADRTKGYIIVLTGIDAIQESEECYLVFGAIYTYECFVIAVRTRNGEGLGLE